MLHFFRPSSRPCKKTKETNPNLLRLLWSSLAFDNCLLRSATCFSRDEIFSADFTRSTFRSFSSCCMKASWERLPLGETCLTWCSPPIVLGEWVWAAVRSLMTASASSLRVTVSSDSSCLTRNSYCTWNKAMRRFEEFKVKALLAPW